MKRDAQCKTVLDSFTWGNTGIHRTDYILCSHLSVGDEPLERVHSIKLLGVHMTDTLKWDDHVKHLVSSCHGVLAALRKIKNFTNYHLRKHLVECLALSRLDFSDIIFYPITDCLLKRLQRIQFAAASFVFGRYLNNIDSILTLGWLPMKERREVRAQSYIFS